MKQAIKKIAGLFFLIFIGSICLSLLFKIHEKDRKRWQELKTQNLQEEKPFFFSINKQESIREFFQEKPPFYVRIKATNSQCFIEKKSSFELEELLHNVEILIQEECYYVDDNGKKTEEKKHAQQKIRFCQADEALYNVQHDTLTAKNVHIHSFLLPGHTPPLTFDDPPFLEVHAEKLTLVLKKKHYRLECEEIYSQFQLHEFLQ